MRKNRHRGRAGFTSVRLPRAHGRGRGGSGWRLGGGSGWRLGGGSGWRLDAGSGWRLGGGSGWRLGGGSGWRLGGGSGWRLDAAMAAGRRAKPSLRHALVFEAERRRLARTGPVDLEQELDDLLFDQRTSLASFALHSAPIPLPGSLARSFAWACAWAYAWACA